MPSGREVDAQKAARQRRRRSYYTAADAGKPCAGGCGGRVVKALNDAGIWVHPTCGPSELDLLPAARVRHAA